MFFLEYGVTKQNVPIHPCTSGSSVMVHILLVQVKYTTMKLVLTSCRYCIDASQVLTFAITEQTSCRTSAAQSVDILS